VILNTFAANAFSVAGKGTIATGLIVVNITGLCCHNSSRKNQAFSKLTEFLKKLNSCKRFFFNLKKQVILRTWTTLLPDGPHWKLMRNSFLQNVFPVYSIMITVLPRMRLNPFLS
jgi:hypothetical protein